jgi:hypothetical protein
VCPFLKAHQDQKAKTGSLNDTDDGVKRRVMGLEESGQYPGTGMIKGFCLRDNFGGVVHIGVPNGSGYTVRAGGPSGTAQPHPSCLRVSLCKIVEECPSLLKSCQACFP